MMTSPNAGEGSAGMKRKGGEGMSAAGEEGEGQDPGGGKKARGGDGKEALAVGRGPRWDLRGSCERSEAQRVGRGDCEEFRLLRERNEGMLEQALSCSGRADVTFSFDDGTALVKGHWGMLCSASQVFGGMFESRMKEVETGVVPVRGVGRESFKGFLEWVYLGRSGEECKVADGRELWLLSDMYDVKGIQRWLVEEGVDGSNLPAAYEFGLLDEAGRKQLVQSCLARFGGGLRGIEEMGLCGVGSAAVQGLVSRRVAKGGRREVLEGFQFVERWWRANGGEGGKLRREDVDAVLGGLDLSCLSAKELAGTVRRLWFVDPSRMVELLCDKVENPESETAEYEADYTAFGVADPEFGDVLSSATAFATHGKGSALRLAVVEKPACLVRVFNVEKGALVMSVGRIPPLGYHAHPYLGQSSDLKQVSDVAFDKNGSLYVSDLGLNEICVFDTSGRLTRRWRPSTPGQLCSPRGLVFTPGGHLVVTDTASVKVFGHDGIFLREYGSKGTGEGQFDCPRGIAVRADGIMYVADSGNSRVQVFDSSELHLPGSTPRVVGSIGVPGHGPGQLRKPHGVAVGAGGEVIVSDSDNVIQVFDSDGAYLGKLGGSQEGGDGVRSRSVAVDQEGRNVFVAPDGSNRVLVYRA